MTCTLVRCNSSHTSSIIEALFALSDNSESTESVTEGLSPTVVD